MANKTRPMKIHGIDVTQIELQGKYYTPVAARVKIAQNCAPEAVRAATGGFHVVSHSILPVADRWAFTCIVEYPVGSGVHTCGSDFIDVKDATGLAKAETSAIGRALSFHGIDIEGGIASAEEMERVGSTQQDVDLRVLNPGSTLERVQEFQQIAESTNPMVQHAPTPIRAAPKPSAKDMTVPEFLRQVRDNLGMTPKQALEELGVKSLASLDLQQAYNNLTAQQDPYTDGVVVETEEQSLQRMHRKATELGYSVAQWEQLQDDCHHDLDQIAQALESAAQHDLRALNTAGSRKGVH